MAFFEFLSTATRTGIISTDFGTIAFYLARRSIAAIALLLGHNELRTPAPALDLLGLLLFFDRLQKEEKTQSILFDTSHQIFEQYVGFFFVFDQWIALTIPSQSDAFFEVVHREKMVFPMRVNDLQHEHAFVVSHLRSADERFLVIVFLMSFRNQGLFDFFRTHVAWIDTFGAEIEAELLQDRGLKAVEIPFVRMGFLARMTPDQIDDDVVGNTYQVFLLVFTFQQLLAQAVHRFALLVHDVVIFEHVFAVREVLAFNPLLGILDLLRDKARFDGNTFFHSQALHDPGDPVGSENPHQIIFKRHVKTRRARIPLTARSSTQLIVDAPRFVPFRTDDVKPAQLNNFFVLLIDLRLYLSESLIPLLGSRV